MTSAAAHEPCQRERIRGPLPLRCGHSEAGKSSSCMNNRRPSPGPGPQSAPAAASAASGAATSGRSRWDSRSAFPRVSPARFGAPVCLWSVAGPDAGRGLDVYADQTLLDAIWGRAGRVPNAPPDTPMEWNPRLRPPSDGPSPVPRGGPRRGMAGCGLAWPGALLRCRLRRPPAPRRTPGAACRARRGLGRSSPSVPGGTAGPAAAGRGPGGRGGGRGLPSGRAGLHLVGDDGGARGNCRGSFGASACRPPSGPLRGRTLVGAPRGGGP